MRVPNPVKCVFFETDIGTHNKIKTVFGFPRSLRFDTVSPFTSCCYRIVNLPAPFIKRADNTWKVGLGRQQSKMI